MGARHYALCTVAVRSITVSLFFCIFRLSAAHRKAYTAIGLIQRPQFPVREGYFGYRWFSVRMRPNISTSSPKFVVAIVLSNVDFLERN